MRTVMRIAWGLLSVSLLLLPTTLAQGTIDETRTADPDGSVEITNVNGSVSVSGWDRSEVQITGTLGEGTQELRFETDGDHTLVEVVLPRHAKDVEGSDLTIHLPWNSRVEISTVNADVQAENLREKLVVETVSGDVGIEGELRRVDVATVSGEVRLLAATDRVAINSVSGDIVVPRAQGRVSVQTVSSDVEIGGTGITSFEFNSVSGDLEFSGSLASAGSYGINTHSGDVDLLLPEALNAEIDINTFSGDIESEFGGKIRRRKASMGLGSSMLMTVGSGDAELSINTFSGDINIKKQ